MLPLRILEEEAESEVAAMTVVAMSLECDFTMNCGQGVGGMYNLQNVTWKAKAWSRCFVVDVTN